MTVGVDMYIVTFSYICVFICTYYETDDNYVHSYFHRIVFTNAGGEY